MREIKFRAWDKEEKIMIPADLFAFEDYEPLAYLFKSTEFDFLQFTGLHDKFDKEAYEFDILKYDIGYGIIRFGRFLQNIEEYEREFIGFYVEWKIRYFPDSPEHLFVRSLAWEKEIEIIGNIYENPELLK